MCITTPFARRHRWLGESKVRNVHYSALQRIQGRIVDVDFHLWQLLQVCDGLVVSAGQRLNLLFCSALEAFHQRHELIPQPRHMLVNLEALDYRNLSTVSPRPFRAQGRLAEHFRLDQKRGVANHRLDAVIPRG